MSDETPSNSPLSQLRPRASLGEAGGGKKVVFLDRDGVINVDHGFIHTVEQWEWIPGVFTGSKLLQDAGFTLAIITNQSGIGRGYYTEEDVLRLHNEIMLPEFEQQGIEIAAIAFCPHAPEEDCNCRKPKRGLIDQIEAKIGPIDYGNSWLIGDKEKDAELGKNIGVHTALVRSRYWEEGDLGMKPDVISSSLLEAAKRVTSD